MFTIKDQDQTNLSTLIAQAIDNDVREETESFTRRMNWFARTREIATSLPKLPVLPADTSIHSSVGNLMFYLPRIQSLINEIKALQWPDIFELNEVDTSIEDGNHYLRYCYNNSCDYAVFIFSPNREGSTCVMTQIGEKEVVIKQKIYEVTCTEGASENPLGQAQE